MTDDDWCSWARRGSGGGAMAVARAWAHGACESETERKKRAEESAARGAMCAESAELAWLRE